MGDNPSEEYNLRPEIGILSTATPTNHRTIRPISTYALHGVAFHDGYFWAIENINGYLMRIDPQTDATQIINSRTWSAFIGATGLAIQDEILWFTSGDRLYKCAMTDGQWNPELFTRFPDTVNGVAISGNSLYVSCQKRGEIFIYDATNGRSITSLYAPGIGVENLVIRGEDLWVSDSLEQTVYCLERATGEVKFSLLTPFESPTGLTFYPNPEGGPDILYVAYASQEPYIRDNPNADPNYELQYRDVTFLHPLYFRYDPEEKYALSNGFLLEMSYVEELSPLDPFELQDLEWKIALPAETDRQQVISIEPVGLPFTIEEKEGQKIAVFKFDQLNDRHRHIFGWRAILKVWGIKYQFTPPDCENLAPIPETLQAQYLVDNENLAMATEIIQRAATDAVGSETNLLRQMYNIRNYVYDHLSYGIKPHIDTPDIALRRGVGSCGEYLGVLLALSRLNGIASRTVGRYKCPAHAHLRNLPLQPDYNHVWMEFYLPGYGWLPMESNPDDLCEGGPYPARFFMGLAWYHAEMAKGVPFEKLYRQGEIVPKEQVSLGDLALNHVRFTILEELQP
ncbi:transglutaminase domain-containing protein [Synechococcus sp. BDU 130192]|uniref:transglutaminase domain-containing protein n=1 Tax=Synechococcus sp. BDU 130192 TaxID=2042059 RepID=UPI0015706431|nr:transglutaminase domain-containing protein [Synechococcus sp. BDU 130192]